MNTQQLEASGLFIVRLLIAAVFVHDATLLARFPDANAAFMAQHGVPFLLLYPTAAFQFAGGLMIIVGLAVRPLALAFSGFCLLTAAIFHHDFMQASEQIAFGKDLGLAAGYLCLFIHGPGGVSIDAVLKRGRNRALQV
ncbi:DoxX family protein [Allorhizobium sp. BGMRC 0089]|uniref:DoxX family protein n=1 Tax=Allorhizobium sonneratiae TaxID=2934936 RepID=UPI00203329CA|nr:DoxX family protein [Allorhizobium sonneratiae]MCM2292373.1 DoxX family protein [Allorhizobium sonneratiae]